MEKYTHNSLMGIKKKYQETRNSKIIDFTVILSLVYIFVLELISTEYFKQNYFHNKVTDRYR